MCGIIGIVSSEFVADRSALVRGRDAMRMRGPDACGEWWSEDGCLGFGHRRLSIIDLDARANQPMLSADGRYVIVFNGEIYNFCELRHELERSEVVFRTLSDTEVLLALFAREGERMLPRLRGMFSLAIWDNRSRELFLARDPYGIKPLYYARTPQGFVFASQVKALVATGLISDEREPAGLVGLCLWGSVPEPWTLYRDVLALAPGHFLRVRESVPNSLECWHDIRCHWQVEGKQITAEELQGRVRAAVKDSVRAHLVADVPVCVFLSGGVDSGSIAALAHESGVDVEGITIGFDEFEGRHDNEVPVARAIAAHYRIRHHVRMVSADEFQQDLPRILEAMDQPSIDGVNTWFASKAAAERGYKVVLSGVGGDELFYGYSAFQQLPRIARVGRAVAAVPGASAMLAGPFAYLAKLRMRPKLAGVPVYMRSIEGAYFLQRSLFLPVELPSLVGADMAREGLTRLGGSPPGIKRATARDTAAAVALLESVHYLRNQLLRDSDWASMGHSLELRTPLVDARLLAALGPYTANFVQGAGKRMLARSPARVLPSTVVNRPKTGFGLPMAAWLSKATDGKYSIAPPLSARANSHWARQWSRIVVEGARSR